MNNSHEYIKDKNTDSLLFKKNKIKNDETKKNKIKNDLEMWLGL